MRLIFAVLMLSVVGCSTTQISVHSNPAGADVYARPVGGGDYRHMGKTPLFLTNLQLEKNYSGSGAIQLEVRMDGYKPDDFVITEVSKVNLSINRELQPKRDLEMQAWLNSHISSMFEVREMVANNRYKEALATLIKLKSQTPNVATLHQMEGGVQLLLRDYAAALRAYRTCVRLDPENGEALKMVRHLEKTYGYRREVDIFDTDLLKEREPARETPAAPKPGVD